jgi:hypothetical protein
MLIEMSCPRHGLERFKVKIITRYNIASNQIMPKLRTKPIRGEVSSLYVGRNVTYNEVKDYLVDYFRERGTLNEILRMKLLV